jgi:Tol biopolymer transport system component
MMNSDGANLRELARLDFLRVFGWSPDGSKLLFNRKGTYFWVDVTSGDIMEIGEWGATSWSPDGQWLAIAVWRGAPMNEQGIYIASLEGWKQLIWPISSVPSKDAWVSDIAWSPDGQRIAFAVSGSLSGCFTISPEGNELESIIDGSCSSIRWSPNSEKLLLSLSDDAAGAHRLYVVELGKEPKLVQEHLLADLSRWSFDGEAILSCREEWELQVIFVEERTIIKIPTEDELVSFTW